ncbi:MAG: YggT family protein [Candidatus Omnitrophica bacterium]|nr:YggT family protein [Candidatus Omnitrophota bacterium]
MFIFGNLIISLAKILDIILTFLYWLILIRALISWVNPDPFNPVVQFLHRTTEPILEPIRRILPRMAIDFSPIVAFLGIVFLKSFLISTLIEMGYRLKNLI